MIVLKKYCGGTTLLELLAALGLLAMVTLVLFEALDAGSHYLAAATAQELDADRIARTQFLLRSLFTRMRPDPDGSQLGSWGSGDAFIFSAPIDQQSISDPYYRVKIVKPLRSAELRLIYAQDRPDITDPELVSSHTHEVLLTDVRRVKFRYWYRDASNRLVETERWNGRVGNPERITVAVEFTASGRTWPKLLVRPLIDRSASCLYDQVSRDCRRL